MSIDNKFCILFGPPGAGKSFLINRLLSSLDLPPTAIESDDLTKDGTEEIQIHGQFIDNVTPGLGSKSFPFANIAGKLPPHMLSHDYMIIVCIENSEKRMQAWYHDLMKILDVVFVVPAKFILVWTNPVTNPDQFHKNRDNIARYFTQHKVPMVKQLTDNEFIDSYSTLNKASPRYFCRLASTPAVLHPQPQAAREVREKGVRDMLAGALQGASELTLKPAVNNAVGGIPDSFPGTVFDDLIGIKRNEPEKYTRLATLGDALLRSYSTCTCTCPTLLTKLAKSLT